MHQAHGSKASFLAEGPANLLHDVDMHEKCFV